MVMALSMSKVVATSSFAAQARCSGVVATAARMARTRFGFAADTAAETAEDDEAAADAFEAAGIAKSKEQWM